MSITIVGLGPASLDRIDRRTRDALLDPDADVVVRTLRHPAAAELAKLRTVVACDDLYDTIDSFDAVYAAVVDRVLETAAGRPVVYAVPGSPVVGERAVPALAAAAGAKGIDVEILPALSFLDLVYVAVGLDPIADGVQIVDARDMPDPLPFHLPMIVTQVDSTLRAADLSVVLGRTLAEDTTVTVVDRLGDDDEVIVQQTLTELATFEAGPRTSVFVQAQPVGLLGLVETNRILRAKCPWDMKQTHHSLLTHLIEEAYETADAIAQLPSEAPSGEADFGAYAEVEDELGDLLLQVMFHATMASEAGAFDIDEVAEINRRKLVRRHPHVFGDVAVSGADEVLANWEQIKQDEKARSSLMDDVPAAMPAVARAMKIQKRAASVGFDWDDATPVFAVLRSEVDELESSDDHQSTINELGDVLFAAINLARHLSVDPEVALRGSVARFMDRFRLVEAQFAANDRSMNDASVDELEAAWHVAKDTLAQQQST